MCMACLLNAWQQLDIWYTASPHKNANGNYGVSGLRLTYSTTQLYSTKKRSNTEQMAQRESE